MHWVQSIPGATFLVPSNPVWLSLIALTPSYHNATHFCHKILSSLNISVPVDRPGSGLQKRNSSHIAPLCSYRTNVNSCASVVMSVVSSIWIGNLSTDLGFSIRCSFTLVAIASILRLIMLSDNEIVFNLIADSSFIMILHMSMIAGKTSSSAIVWGFLHCVNSEGHLKMLSVHFTDLCTLPHESLLTFHYFISIFSQAPHSIRGLFFCGGITPSPHQISIHAD